MMAGLLGLKIYDLSASFLSSGHAVLNSDLVAAAHANVPTKTDTQDASGVQSGGTSPDQSHVERNDSTSAACADGKGCIGQSPVPEEDISPLAESARQDLLSSLKNRSEEMEKQKRNITQERQEIDASETALQKQLKDLEVRQAAISRQILEQKHADDASIDRLVKIYETMPPRDAATIFNIMEPSILTAVLSVMNPRKASAIMAGMLPEKANKATQLMAPQELTSDQKKIHEFF
jgi:flagellar motility protein MotE (MotC chaperone)